MNKISAYLEPKNLRSRYCISKTEGIAESLTIKMSIFLGKLVAKSIINKFGQWICVLYYLPTKESFTFTIHTYPMKEEAVKSRTHIDSGYKILFKKLAPIFCDFFCVPQYQILLFLNY